MRTCPACGEDTKAGYSESCTRCGFSAAGEDAGEPEPVEAEITIGDPPPPTSPPATREPPPPEAPSTSDSGDPPPPSTPPVAAEDEAPSSSRKRPARRLLVWLVVIGGLFIADALGVFDQAPGPDAATVEQAIADDARQYGVEASVDCPDDADQTEIDASFTCTATSPSGKSVTITVTNHEDSFEWQSGPLSTLA